MERDQILVQIREYMSQLFDIDRAAVRAEASLSDDLDLDSIDAIDLVVKLQELIGRKIKAEEFQTVRTVGDIVERIYEITRPEGA